MTLVIGMLGTHEDCTYIGGDAFCTFDEGLTETCVEPKIMKIAEGLWLGSAGLVSDDITIKKVLIDLVGSYPESTDYGKLISSFDFAVALQEALEKPLSDESCWFLATNRKLMYLGSDGALWEPRSPYVAIGMGRTMALSTMAYIFRAGLPVSKDVLDRVITACADHSMWVKGPSTIVKVM